MSSPLVWKVYSGGGVEMVGSLRYAEDAAALAAQTPDAIVKVDGRIVYRNGTDGDAGDSYDEAAGLMRLRRQKHAAAYYGRLYGTVDNGLAGLST